MGYIEETGVAQHYRDIRIAADLRGHERHPGHGPRRAQAADAGGRRRHRPPRPHRRRRRRPGRGGRRSSHDPTAVAACRARRGDVAGSSSTAWPTRSMRSPGRRRTCACSASSRRVAHGASGPSRPQASRPTIRNERPSWRPPASTASSCFRRCTASCRGHRRPRRVVRASTRTAALDAVTRHTRLTSGRRTARSCRGSSGPDSAS